MLLIDDILKSPVKGVLWVLREVATAAEQEMKAESERIKEQLRELYMQLEQGRLSDAEFDQREGELLDRLDELEGDRSDDVIEEQGDDEDEDEDEDEDGAEASSEYEDGDDEEEDDESDEDDEYEYDEEGDDEDADSGDAEDAAALAAGAQAGDAAQPVQGAGAARAAAASDDEDDQDGDVEYVGYEQEGSHV